jgi:hypothetical protein
MATDQELFDLATATGTPAGAPPSDTGQPPAAKPEAPATAPPAAPEQADTTPEGHIPSWRLREEREARERAEARAMEYERREAAYRAQQPAPQAPDPFEHPDRFVDARVGQIVDPLQRQMIYNNHFVASNAFGQDKVDKAIDWFDKTMPPGTHEYQRIMGHPNPFVAVVDAHRKAMALAEFGDDPGAFKQSYRKALLDDPEYKREALAYWQGQARGHPGGGNVRMPTAPSAPSGSLPSLSRVGANAPAVDTRHPDADLTDEELFFQATKRDNKGRFVAQ